MNLDTTATRLDGGTRGRWGRWLALAALVMGTLVLGLDMTILLTALPTLSARLGATTEQLQWVSAVYTLALAGLMLPAGVLSDRYGRRRMLLLGLALFGASSVAASQVSTATGLIVMRAVMGVGGAVILPLSLSVLPSLFSEAERPRAIAIAGAGAFLGLPLGPLVAGWLLDHYAWGSVFLINAPVVAVALLGVWFFVPETKDAAAPTLDWLGAVLSVVGVTALVYGIIQEPANGWSDPRVILGAVGGALVLAAFVARELRTRMPLIDLRLFADPRFGWPTLTFVVVGATMTGVLFVLTPYLQIVEGNDAQATGVRLLPLIGAMLAGALASPRLTRRLRSKVAVAGGQLVTAGGLLLLSRAAAGSGYPVVAAGMAVVGLGLGLSMVPALDMVLSALPAANTGGGTALARALQNVAASFGVAILGSVLNAAYRTSLDPRLTGLPARAKDVADGSLAGAAAVAAKLPAGAGGPLFAAAKDAYAGGMSTVMLVCAVIVVLGSVLVAAFLPASSAGPPRADARERTWDAPAGPAEDAAREVAVR
jgi:DHA2 family multidrug resistance protein-like MFS transporter